MANPKPGPGKRFRKGQVANPRGGGAHNPVVKKLKALSNDVIAEVGTVLLEGTIQDLKDIVEDPKATVLKKWLATVAARGVTKADHKSLDTILTRIAGKPKERIEFGSDPENPIVLKVAAMSRDERIKFLKQSAKDLEDIDDID